MNYVDATCIDCHDPFRWLSGTPRRCGRCRLGQMNNVVDSSQLNRMKSVANGEEAMEKNSQINNDDQAT